VIHVVHLVLVLVVVAVVVAVAMDGDIVVVVQSLALEGKWLQAQKDLAKKKQEEGEDEQRD